MKNGGADETEEDVSHYCRGSLVKCGIWRDTERYRYTVV